MDLKEIQNLIKFVAKSGASEVKLEMDDIKITIKTGSEETKEITFAAPQMPYNAIPQQIEQATAPVAAATPAESKSKSTEEDDFSKYTVIKAPIIGTLYRKPSPDTPVFKEVGDTIQKGDVLCIIEAMKLFNEIESEVSGKIVKVLVDEASPVEFDQPLFLIDPS